jgi:Rps23 Pro-64 3,4-dihydroxylase Tpa1-like proline 4-hydroxylase
MNGNDEVAVLAGRICARIGKDAQSLAAQWNHPEGTRTRHFVVDDLLPEQDSARIYASFPRTNATWFQRESFRERKKTFAKLDSVDPLIGHITDAFHRPEVLQVVKDISGIERLEADPELYAGGISMMGQGDFLNPHIDNSHDSRRERYRRLNLLYYISPEWQLEYGGNLELWDERVAVPRVIQSKYNRLVVMETGRHSWHSVSPVAVARDRCCVSNYYFSKSSPGQRHYYHVTSFIGRPDQTALRLWGRVDNFARQSVAVLSGKSRGRSLSRGTNADR